MLRNRVSWELGFHDVQDTVLVLSYHGVRDHVAYYMMLEEDSLPYTERMSSYFLGKEDFCCVLRLLEWWLPNLGVSGRKSITMEVSPHYSNGFHDTFDFVKSWNNGPIAKADHRRDGTDMEDRYQRNVYLSGQLDANRSVLCLMGWGIVPVLILVEGNIIGVKK